MMITPRTLYLFEATKVIDHTPTIREVHLLVRSHPEFKFKAGQFVTLHVPAGEKAILRAYSIASSEQRTDGFNLIFKFVPEGVASTYIWKLKEKQTLQFTGPFGRVLFKEPPTQQAVFLSTGSGLSQHFCFAESKAAQHPQTSFKLLIGVRNESEIYYQKELQDLQQKNSNVSFEFVLSRPSLAWTGKTGYVQNFLQEFDFKNTPTTFYLCGNGNMIKDTKKILEENSFDRTQIFAEAFD